MLTEKQRQEIEIKFVEIMKVLKLDLTDPSLKETPKRISKFYSEFFGYEDDNIFTAFPAEQAGSQMVVLKKIPFQSLCEHHFLPFIGTTTVAYIPGTKIIGVSKLARITRLMSSRPQVQERLANEIANQLEEILTDAKGIGVYISAQHTCMTMRGIRSDGNMTTTVLRGCFDDAGTKDEFLRYCLQG